MEQRLAGIDEVAWASLTHAYGEATDTPELIKRLYEADRYEDAFDALDASILHQGMICHAAVQAAPFLAEVAVDPDAVGRHQALGLLVNLTSAVPTLAADGYSETEIAEVVGSGRELATCVTVLLSGLADDDPVVRGKIAMICGHLGLSVDAAAALHDRLAVEDDTMVLAMLAMALSAHGELSRAEASQLHGDQVRFAAAWGAVVARRRDPRDLETLAELWNTCVEDLAALVIPDDALAAVLEPRIEFVSWLTRLASHGGRAAFDAFRGLYWFGDRRDLASARLDALLHLAAQSFAGFDEDYRDHILQVPVTPRNYLVLAMVGAVPSAGERRSELLDALGRLVRSTPVPRRVFRLAEHQETAPWAKRRPDPVRDIRVDAFPALLGHTGSTDLVRAVLADRPDEVRGPSTTAGVLLDCAPTMTADQAAELAEAVLEQMRRTENLADWLRVWAALPDAASRPWWDDVVSLVRVTDVRLRFDGVPLLLHWGTPAAEALLAEWADRDGERSRWARLALGVLRRDADLADAALTDPLPAAAEEFLALADGFTTPRLLAVCRSMLADRSDVGGRTLLAAIRVVGGADGLAVVWPRVLAEVRSGDDVWIGDALPTTTELLAQNPDDPAAAQCRAEFVATLTSAVDSKPPRTDRERPVLAAAALLDLGEPLPETAAKRATVMLKTFAKQGWFPLAHALGAAFRVLEAAVPGQDETTRHKTIKVLRGLVELPVRIQAGSDPLSLSSLELDERFTTHLRQLVEVIG